MFSQGQQGSCLGWGGDRLRAGGSTHQGSCVLAPRAVSCVTVQQPQIREQVPSATSTEAPDPVGLGERSTEA